MTVSIHAPTRGATEKTFHVPLYPSVSIHAPTRGATYGIKVRFFAIGVSIHAPTRGATRPPMGGCLCKQVSIHAPTRGATVKPSLIVSKNRFQSTHPRGVRLEYLKTLAHRDKVSIHAPTRGATPFKVLLTICSLSFNPRTHEGCDSPFRYSSSKV